MAGRDAQTTDIRKQFTETGQPARELEGVWWGDNGASFVSSFARAMTARPPSTTARCYDPKSQTVTLKTIFAVNATPDIEGSNVDGPDNITVPSADPTPPGRAGEPTCRPVGRAPCTVTTSQLIGPR